MEFTAPPTVEEQLFIQRVAALGWRTETVEERDGWLLRANSALPLTSRTTLAVSERSLETIQEFFGRQRLPVTVQVPLPACNTLDKELARQNFVVSDPTHVLTARVQDVLGDKVSGDTVEVEISTTPDKGWIVTCERWARNLGTIAATS